MILYNEIEKNPADWMRNLVAAGEIPHGEIDERSIKEIKGADLSGLRQFHTFAGIGGWPLALKLAGWPDDEEVWTGSCPCQPFSSAGKGGGTEDPRHLWPDFLRLITERLPSTIFGEQVASKAGRQWLVGVRTDLEALGYRVGRADLCAAGAGAPHIRQRLYWVADRRMAQDSDVVGRERGRDGDPSGGGRKIQAPRYRTFSRMGDGKSVGRKQIFAERSGRSEGIRDTSRYRPSDDGVPVFGMADEHGPRREECGASRIDEGAAGGRAFSASERDCSTRRVGYNDGEGQQKRGEGRAEPNWESIFSSDGAWSDFRIVPCTDGKARRTGARVFPLAYGLPRSMGELGPKSKGLASVAGLSAKSLQLGKRARIGMLKGSGNAIAPALAAKFIMAYLEAR